MQDAHDGASTSASLQHNPTYYWQLFHPSKGFEIFEHDNTILARVETLTQARPLVPPHVSENTATNDVDPVVPQKICFESNDADTQPHGYRYITTMVSRKVRQQEKCSRWPPVSANLSCLCWKVVFPLNLRIPKYKMFNGRGNPNQHVVEFMPWCGIVINGPLATMEHYYCSFFWIARGSSLPLVCKSTSKLFHQLTSDGAWIPSTFL